MSTLALSASRSSISTSSASSNIDHGLSPAAMASSSNLSLASSSSISLDTADQENATLRPQRLSPKKEKKRQTEDEPSAPLPMLVISSQMTETSLAIADIQARIFSIQELRHKSQESGNTTGTTNNIDQSLMALDEKLESVSKDVKVICDAMEPYSQASSTPTLNGDGDAEETAMMLRKHAALVSDWEGVQDESDTLREELKEDKWLTVFRTVTDQADGMMSSLEKAVNRCQDFISQVYKQSTEDAFGQSLGRDSSPPTLELFNSLLDSYEAKKKHYVPATSKVLSIIDKGVRDRVTKNGETLRRHSESSHRWKSLRDKIAHVDADMESVRRYLASGDAPSESGSSQSGLNASQSGYLVTPPNGTRSSRSPSATSTLSRSISPLRKFARRFTGTQRLTPSPAPPVTPLSLGKRNGTRAPSSEPPASAPILRRQRTSIFSRTPTTPDRPNHKYSQSLTPDSSPSKSEIKGGSQRPGWNSSTRVEQDERTIKASSQKRSPSAAGMYADPTTPGRRSVSRQSMSSSRPFSPSHSHSYGNHPPMPSFRPPSRAQTPSRSYTPGPVPPTPRQRPKTPSGIPAPSYARVSPSSGSSSRPFSPAFSADSGPSPHPPRPPSRSMIPVPSVHLSSASRPGTAMSGYDRSESPTYFTFRASAMRAQTPETTLKARAAQIPVYPGTPGTLGRTAGRKSLPPSSFRDGSSSSRAPSRPSSRSGAHTPSLEYPIHEYIPSNPMDPLDAEVGNVVNSIAHGLLVERVDKPLKKIPKAGEEIKAQYAFSSGLSRKVVNLKLTTMTRVGKTSTEATRKVMCRVGGGWQDLSLYILNRQAGM
ncbi:hypothetical protein CYLTODRAFT_419658 [Cylindrobasidium torrendii FP15055 ss-10]|uniref:GAR domain-containing protein n=1 Tax=Cylindrobasidium torrendii FP15055 ss-10 TaxID=1314674 RepID=A0A0D7BJZ6_9AGAR|nr:hypothetical protein CYLTODRAFT_419658 [Cylindrobasidium torrendii FP15055 ss-10]